MLNKHLPNQAVNQQVDPALPVCRIKPSKCSLIVGVVAKDMHLAVRPRRCDWADVRCCRVYATREGRSRSAVVVLLFL
jgi:hypothetical protein